MRLNNMRTKYELNNDTLTLRKAKADCEARLTEAIKNNNRNELIEYTGVYYDILIALDVQRQLALDKKRKQSLNYYYNKKNN